MGDVVQLRAAGPSDEELGKLLDALESGGLIMLLAESRTDLLPDFLVFEFYDPAVSQDAMAAAHVLRDRFKSGDKPFADAVRSHCYAAGAAYRSV